MTPDRWKQVRDLMETALELPSTERGPYLDRACLVDRSLRAEVDTLLRAYGDADTLLDRPVFDLRRQPEEPPDTDEPMLGTIGPYRVLRLLGHGGMGRVYLAERTGCFRQRVAVKVLRRGLDSPLLVRRFRGERQILAQLEHPFIARILDGGSLADGRPYLVMELVDGVPIDLYCDEQGLDVGARLELMCRVCEAVQHAHRNLIVHRDLKPANILITADGYPKLLDFGIAKLLRPEVLPLTVPTTIPGLTPMTPEYASPEQVRGEHVTTASDVYSLGVLLYELLTGRSPYQVPGGEPADLARAVCGQEPVQPSLAVTRPDRQSWSQRLRGDVDTIVLTALRKEPERRYVAVEKLTEDIRRHLSGHPVQAHPDTFGYRTRKLLRRHPWGARVSAAALAVPLILVLQCMKLQHTRHQGGHAAPPARHGYADQPADGGLEEGLEQGLERDSDGSETHS